ncbi:MAG: DNA internalization-related competence protein ComEC/Rec2, partial [Lachnospiraceae bacterium]
KLQKTYMTYLGENGAGVVSSMLLGERALLSDETKELYRHGGISHILAISGLHVSLLGMAVYQLLRRTVLGRNGAIPAACACVILYGRFVEAGTSTKRAVIMFFLLLLAAALGRTYDTLSAMSVSAVVILCQTPGALYTASFQLSYAAAYGASVLAVLLKERERERSLKEKAVWTAKQADSKWVRLRVDITEQVKSTFLFGGAIQLVTLPVTIFHYFEYPLYGFFLNPLVVPLMTILLFCALLTGVCGCFSVWLGHFFAGGVGAILWVYEALCGIVSKLPFSLLLFGKPALWQIGIYFTVLAVCLYIRRGGRRGRKNRRGQKGIVCVLVLLPLCLLPLPCAAFEAAFLDVGQGDGIVLRERTGAVLTVDGGSADVQKVGEKRLAAYLKAKGIRVIDCAIISHGDSDHISGIRELLAGMPVYSSYRASAAGYEGELFIKRIVLPIPAISDPACQALAKLAEEKNVEVCYLAAGDRLKAGEELVLSCLAPKEGAVYSDKNAASLVLLASYGEFDLLLTGDMDAAGERKLLEEGAVDGISVEVLKVAHHGSSSSSSEEFLAALKPAFSVISCGKGNRYGHPHKEVLRRLEEHGTEVYRTDECGAIEVRVKRNKAEILVHGGG